MVSVIFTFLYVTSERDPKQSPLAPLNVEGPKDDNGSRGAGKDGPGPQPILGKDSPVSRIPE